MINNKEIQENGNLICKFLELNVIDKRAKKNPTFYIPFSTIVYIEDYLGASSLERNFEIPGSQTLFHTSWDWLMEVCKKIRTIPGQCKDLNKEDFKTLVDKSVDVYCGKSDCDIEKTYRAAVEFIKFYFEKKSIDFISENKYDRESYSSIFNKWLGKAELVSNAEIELSQDFCTFLDSHYNESLKGLIDLINKDKISFEKGYDPVEELRTCIEEAPLDFLGTGSNSSYANKEEREWHKRVEKALSEIDKRLNVS